MNVNTAMEWERYVREKSAVAGGSFFASVEMVTEAKLRKTSKDGSLPKRDFTVMKHTCIHGDCLFGATSYETFVRNQRKRENHEHAEDFNALKPTGKHHIDNYVSILQADKNENQYYLQLFFPKAEKARITVKYYLNGEEVTLDDPRIAPYVSDAKGGGSGRQETAKEIIIRTPKVENVKRVKCGEFTFHETVDLTEGTGDDYGQTVEETDEAARIFAEIHATLKTLVEKVEKHS